MFDELFTEIQAAQAEMSAWRRRLTGLQGLAPRHKFDCRDRGKHTDHNEH